MGEVRSTYKILVGSPETLGYLGVNGTIILKLISKKYDMRAWSGFIW
jgi:hypothetical protein